MTKKDKVLANAGVRVAKAVVEALVAKGSMRKVKNSDRVMQFVASTERVDEQGDIVRQNWDLDDFKNNPVVLWNHDQTMPIGRAVMEEVLESGTYGDRKVGKHLSIWVEWMDKSHGEHVEPLFNSYADGFLKGGSVGFIPKDMDPVNDPDERKALGLGEMGVLYNEAKLSEWTLCSVPANPDALTARGFTEAVVKSLGFKGFGEGPGIVTIPSDRIDWEEFQEFYQSNAEMYASYEGSVEEGSSIIVAFDDISDANLFAAQLGANAEVTPKSAEPKGKTVGGLASVAEEIRYSFDEDRNPEVYSLLAAAEAGDDTALVDLLDIMNTADPAIAGMLQQVINSKSLTKAVKARIEKEVSDQELDRLYDIWNKLDANAGAMGTNPGADRVISALLLDIQDLLDGGRLGTQGTDLLRQYAGEDWAQEIEDTLNRDGWNRSLKPETKAIQTEDIRDLLDGYGLRGRAKDFVEEAAMAHEQGFIDQARDLLTQAADATKDRYARMTIQGLRQNLSGKPVKKGMSSSIDDIRAATQSLTGEAYEEVVDILAQAENIPEVDLSVVLSDLIEDYPEVGAALDAAGIQLSGKPEVTKDYMDAYQVQADALVTTVEIAQAYPSFIAYIMEGSGAVYSFSDSLDAETFAMDVNGEVLAPVRTLSGEPETKLFEGNAKELYELISGIVTDMSEIDPIYEDWKNGLITDREARERMYEIAKPEVGILLSLKPETKGVEEGDQYSASEIEDYILAEFEAAGEWGYVEALNGLRGQPAFTEEARRGADGVNSQDLQDMITALENKSAEPETKSIEDTLDDLVNMNPDDERLRDLVAEVDGESDTEALLDLIDHLRATGADEGIITSLEAYTAVAKSGTKKYDATLAAEVENAIAAETDEEKLEYLHQAAIEIDQEDLIAAEHELRLAGYDELADKAVASDQKSGKPKRKVYEYNEAEARIFFEGLPLDEQNDLTEELGIGNPPTTAFDWDMIADWMSEKDALGKSLGELDEDTNNEALVGLLESATAGVTEAVEMAGDGDIAEKLGDVVNDLRAALDMLLPQGADEPTVVVVEDETPATPAKRLSPYVLLFEKIAGNYARAAETRD